MTMDTRTAVLEIIATIAPDAELDTLGGGEDLREALDIDSMDHLNLIIAVHEKFGIDIPERDYGRLVTLDGLLAYIDKKRGK
jgi:acyl carrier protein